MGEVAVFWMDPESEPPAWAPPRARARVINPAFENLRGAWEEDRFGAELPVAVYPTYVHARLRAQRSCFTIQGKRKQGLDSLLPGSVLKRYTIDPARRESMRSELRLLGITHSVVFPDLDGLARELKTRFV